MGRWSTTAVMCLVLVLPAAFAAAQTPVPAPPRTDAPHQPAQPSSTPAEVASSKPESETRLMGCLVPGPGGSFVLEDATNGAPGAAPGQKFMIIASEKLELAKHINKRVTFSEVANSTSSPPAAAAATTAAATAAAVSGVSPAPPSAATAADTPGAVAPAMPRFVAKDIIAVGAACRPATDGGK